MISKEEEVEFINCDFFKEVSFEKSVFSDKRYEYEGARRNKIANIIDLRHTIKNTIFHKESSFEDVVFNNVEFKDVDFSKCILAP